MKIARKTSFQYFPRNIRFSSHTNTSLIPDTLNKMEIEEKINDEILPIEQKQRLSLEERKIKRRSLEGLNIPSFNTYLKEHNLTITRTTSQIFQMNITRYCNQACKHCHVDSSPKRKEFMTEETFNKCLEIIENSPSITCIDITGGAPELHPLFRSFIQKIRSNSKINSNIQIISRCNLTVLLEPGQEDLAQFYKDYLIHIIASLPCYTQQNVDKQRGNKVFERSIQGLQQLNQIGYGINSSSLILDLVYNPGGAFLPSNQFTLEKQYKEILSNEFNIHFNHLLTLTNMPINRFADQLYVSNKQEEYLHLLVNNFNSNIIHNLMCRNTINVDWNGIIYDCDFNQQINLPLLSCQENNNNNNNEIKKELSVFDIKTVNDILKYSIQFKNHCYGCTAGSGSSCQGSL